MNKLGLFVLQNYKSGTFWLLMAIFVLLGMAIGFLLCYIKSKRERKFQFSTKLETAILVVSSMIAFGCLVASILGETTVSIQFLSFYVSFIFAWLLTKTSAQNDFKKMQHKVAKNTYRHIQDVEITAIITKKRVEKLCYKADNGETITLGELEGVVDDLNSILTGIRSNKADWKDMLKKRYRKKISAEEDPEGKVEKMRESPAASEIKKEFEDIKNEADIQ